MREDAGASRTEAARERLAAAQAGLLAALTGSGEVPPGFDPARLRIQREALAVKRVSVMAKVAPDLPRILGERYRPVALAYARSRPMRGGYPQDAAAFAEHTLATGGRSVDAGARRELQEWLAARTPGRARPSGRLARLLRGRRKEGVGG